MVFVAGVDGGVAGQDLGLAPVGLVDHHDAGGDRGRLGQGPVDRGAQGQAVEDGGEHPDQGGVVEGATGADREAGPAECSLMPGFYVFGGDAGQAVFVAVGAVGEGGVGEEGAAKPALGEGAVVVHQGVELGVELAPGAIDLVFQEGRLGGHFGQDVDEAIEVAGQEAAADAHGGALGRGGQLAAQGLGRFFDGPPVAPLRAADEGADHEGGEAGLSRGVERGTGREPEVQVDQGAGRVGLEDEGIGLHGHELPHSRRADQGAGPVGDHAQRPVVATSPCRRRWVSVKSAMSLGPWRRKASMASRVRRPASASGSAPRW